MKGIILAGGSGTRLSPVNAYISKQLLPIYDKPMIYYPLSTLLLAGITEILIISTTEHLKSFQLLFSDGVKLGVSINYAVQKKPRGIVDALLIAEKFIGNDSVCLILGDNIFYGQDLSQYLYKSVHNLDGALIYGYPVKNPIEFGVVEFDEEFNVISIEEKPLKPRSDYAIPGIYFYDNTCINLAKKVKPSSRNELEITDLNKLYLEKNRLKVMRLGRGFSWLDTGTFESIKSASDFVEIIQKRQGFSIACIEEIVWRKGLIDREQLLKLAENYGNSSYGKYIYSLVDTTE
jgi:glucose-1-phosphate thymidylyltransferase